MRKLLDCWRGMGDLNSRLCLRQSRQHALFERAPLRNEVLLWNARTLCYCKSIVDPSRASSRIRRQRLRQLRPSSCQNFRDCGIQLRRG